MTHLLRRGAGLHWLDEDCLLVLTAGRQALLMSANLAEEGGRLKLPEAPVFHTHLPAGGAVPLAAATVAAAAADRNYNAGAPSPPHPRGCTAPAPQGPLNYAL